MATVNVECSGVNCTPLWTGDEVPEAPGQSVDPEMKFCPEGYVPVPSGTFQMGSEDGDSDERPVHQVTVSSFCLQRHEITNREYEPFRQVLMTRENPPPPVQRVSMVPSSRR